MRVRPASVRRRTASMRAGAPTCRRSASRHQVGARRSMRRAPSRKFARRRRWRPQSREHRRPSIAATLTSMARTLDGQQRADLPVDSTRRVAAMAGRTLRRATGSASSVPASVAATFEVLGDADHRRALLVGELDDLERQPVPARARQLHRRAQLREQARRRRSSSRFMTAWRITNDIRDRPSSSWLRWTRRSRSTWPSPSMPTRSAASMRWPISTA